MPQPAGAAGTTPRNACVAVCPGSFDPLTMGHVDIIERAARLYDRVIVAVLLNLDKRPLFTVEERVGIIEEVFAGHGNVSVDTFEGLLVDYARQKGASVIVRGLRAVSDFEYEFQMALMNRHLAPGIETTFLMPAEQYTYISSRLIKEVFSLGGSVDGLVPPVVETKLQARRQARPLPHARTT
jgi:pantetheine-phosphate adenylyltransferase